MFTTGETVGLAEWIIEDNLLVSILFSMICGFVFGYLIVMLRKLNLFDDKGFEQNLLPKVPTLIAFCLSLLGLLGYFLFALFCHWKEHCNEIHSYVVFIPVSYYLIDPLGQPTFEISRNQTTENNVRDWREETVGMAEWIIDDICLVKYCIFKSLIVPRGQPTSHVL